MALGDWKSSGMMAEIKAMERITPRHGLRLRSFLRHSRAERGRPVKFFFSVPDHGIGERGSK